ALAAHIVQLGVQGVQRFVGRLHLPIQRVICWKPSQLESPPKLEQIPLHGIRLQGHPLGLVGRDIIAIHTAIIIAYPKNMEAQAETGLVGLGYLLPATPSLALSTSPAGQRDSHLQAVVLKPIVIRFRPVRGRSDSMKLSWANQATKKPPIIRRARIAQS